MKKETEGLRSLYKSTFEELEELSDSLYTKRNELQGPQVETSFWSRAHFVERQQERVKKKTEELRRRIRKDAMIHNKRSHFFKSVGRDTKKQHTTSSCSLPLSVSVPSSSCTSFTFSQTSRGDLKSKNKNDRIYIGPDKWYKPPLTDEEEILTISEFLRSPLNDSATSEKATLEEHMKRISHQRRLRRRALARMIQIRRGQTNADVRLSSSRRERERKICPFDSTVPRFYQEEN